MNILSYTDNLGQWIRGYLPDPISAFIYINSFANRDYIEIDIDRYTIMIDELYDMGCKSIVIDGYEPLLHSKIIDILSTPSIKGMKVVLITGKEDIDDTVSTMLVQSCNMIILRYDSIFPMKSITELSSKKALFNIMLIIRWRHDEECRIIDVVDIFDKYVIPYGIDYIQIVPYITDNIEKMSKSRNLEVLRSTIKAIFPNDISRFQFVGFDDIGKEGFGRCYERCHGGNFIICISADGFVYPCRHYMGVRPYALGDYLNDSIEEIWKGKLHTDFISGFNVRGCIPICCFHDINNMLETIDKPLFHEDIITTGI